jgi:hypothetical protein
MAGIDIRLYLAWCRAQEGKSQDVGAGLGGRAE